MKRINWLIALMIIFLYGPVSAEFYKYTDQDGNVRFTDDLSTVPIDQRPKIKSYENSKSTESLPPAKDNAKPASKAGKSPALKQNITIEAQAEQIREKKSELSKEYKSLINEKAQLEEARKNAKRKKEIDKVNRKISELNDKIYQWEQKRNAFNSELDAYNARATEAIKKSQSK